MTTISTRPAASPAKAHSHARSGFRFDLGIRTLLPEWRAIFSRKYLREDAIAAVSVACIALPLAMAIALASGVRPEVGLFTAIVAGIVGGLFGGTPLAVTGPAAVMVVLVASIIEKHGLSGLLIVGVLAGALQVLSGVLRLGRVLRFVPLPVVLGFTAGIGAVILIGQLPRALGLPPPDQDHVASVLVHIGQLLHMTHLPTLALAALAVVIMLGLPRLAPRAPAPLLAVIVPTVLVMAMGIDVAVVGEIPRVLPLPSAPTLARTDWGDLVGSAFAVYALASLESLLSSSALGRIARDVQHDADQELIGLGLANIAATSLGGVPATGVIARSSLNVLAGAKTRRAGILHAVVLAVAAYALLPWMSGIPVAALVGVLFALALQMLSPRQLITLWRVSRTEGIVVLVTFAVMVAVDLVVGVQAGLLAALAFAAVRLGKTQASVRPLGDEGPYRFALNGPLTFLSQGKIDGMRGEVAELDPARGVVMDLSLVTEVDTTGADNLRGFVEDLLARGCQVALLRAPDRVCDAVGKCDAHGNLAPVFVSSESEVAMGVGSRVPPWERLASGVERFRGATRSHYKGLFEKLARGQHPHTLFIACADSRVSPALMTTTEPGELFILRNVGNIVPPWEGHGPSAEGAGVEFAVGVLGVKQIIVCGHSSCGAMKALMGGDVDPELSHVATWVQRANAVKERLPVDASPDAAGRANVLMQLEMLRTYPVVRRKVEAGELKLFGWFFDIGRGDIEEWSPERGAFVPVGRGAARKPSQPPVDAAATPAPAEAAATPAPGELDMRPGRA